VAKKLIYLGRLLAALSAVPLPAAAEVPGEEAPIEVVVTADRFETPTEQAIGSITVITSEEAQNKQQTAVADALRSVPALDVVSSGAAGGNISVFMRGANAEHTLVLIDGLEVNNPASPNRAYNFSGLRFDNVERVEILRGPSSTLYGSDAMGGVINIITKQGQGPPSLYASAEAGSYRTFIERAGLSGGSVQYDYSFALYREDTAGISAAAAGFGNSENDGYSNTSFSSRLGFRPAELLEVRAFARHIDARAQLDNNGGVFGDDPNRESADRQFFIRGEAKLALAEKLWQPLFGISHGRQEFADDNDPDALHPLEIMRSKYTGSITKLDWQNNLTLNKWLSLVAGLENEEESAHSTYFSDGVFGPFVNDFARRSAAAKGGYLQVRGETARRFCLTAGLRVDGHSKFSPQLTWRVGPAFWLPETGTKLSAIVGTGFKAPSLFQLYSAYGNPALRPEESLGFDAGIEQSLWQDKAALGAAFFYNDFDKLISFDPNTFVFSKPMIIQPIPPPGWSWAVTVCLILPLPMMLPQQFSSLLA